MSASQAEGRGFKSRFPLQESQGVTSYDVTPFLMRRCRCATNGPFPNLDQPPGEIPKPEHLHGVRPRPSLVQRALQGETGNPFPVYGGGFHMRKCWPKRPTSPYAPPKNGLVHHVSAHGIFCRTPARTGRSPLSEYVLEIMVIVHQTQ